jgi:hypothetical protein
MAGGLLAPTTEHGNQVRSSQLNLSSAFGKSNSIRRMKLRPLDNSSVNSCRGEARISRRPREPMNSTATCWWLPSARRLGNGLPRRENQSLAPFLDLAAAVDDEGHFLAVFHRLDRRTYGGGLDVSDLRITRGFQLSYKHVSEGLRQAQVLDYFAASSRRRAQATVIRKRRPSAQPASTPP